jgi:hypothetical protein
MCRKTYFRSPQWKNLCDIVILFTPFGSQANKKVFIKMRATEPFSGIWKLRTKFQTWKKKQQKITRGNGNHPNGNARVKLMKDDVAIAGMKKLLSTY